MKRLSPPLVSIGLRLAIAFLTALDATLIQTVVRADPALSLLVFLPGILLVSLFWGGWAGCATLGFSLLGSAWYRIPRQVAVISARATFGLWEQELLLALFGLFSLWMMRESRRSRENARTEALRFSLLLRSVADAAFIFDARLRLLAANPAAAALLEQPLPELEARTAGELFARLEGGSRLIALVQGAMESGATVRVEESLYDPLRNRPLELLGSVAPLPDAKKHRLGVFMILTDVTALKNLQARTIDHARHLATAQIATGLIHDFGNVLGVIRSAAALLQMLPADEGADRLKYIEIINNAAADGTELLARLRHTVVGDGGQIRSVDFNRIVGEAINLTRPQWSRLPHLRVDTDLTPVPPVSGNPLDLRRAVTNLILNAAEAIGEQEEGVISIHTEAEGSVLRCWIEDNGPGIASAHQRRIFEPYFTTKSDGTGLGLFGAQRAVLAHGGNLTFFSEPGRGTRFNIELPLAQFQQANSHPQAL